jgi:hypothetical protein
MPRVVCMDASVGLDGIVATFANQRDGDEQEDLIQQHSQKAKMEEAKNEASSSASRSASKR